MADRFCFSASTHCKSYRNVTFKQRLGTTPHAKIYGEKAEKIYGENLPGEKVNFMKCGEKALQGRCFEVQTIWLQGMCAFEQRPSRTRKAHTKSSRSNPTWFCFGLQRESGLE